MTTAQLRDYARLRASECRWREAATAMRAALAAYPGVGPEREPPAMQRRDLDMMFEKIRHWESA